MNFKRLSATLLALSMTATTAAFAAGEAVPTSGLLISPNPNAGYDTIITINGETLESYEYTREIPDTWETETITVQLADIAAVPAGYVPLRAVVQADHGSASWYKDENQSFFYLNGVSIVTDFNDMSVSLNDEKVEEAEALLINGVTYIPVSVLENIEGVTVTDNSEGEVESYEISTPNGAPLMKLAYQIVEDSAMLKGGQRSMEELEEWYGELGFKAEFTTEGVAFLPMNTFPDTLILGKLAEGQEEGLAAFLEEYRSGKEQTFSWYLGQHLLKVQNARFVTEGGWFLFLIAENVEAGVETFRAAVGEME